MKVNCFQLTNGPQLDSCDYSFAIDAVKKKNAKIWIDVLDAGDSEIESILDEINVQGIVRRFCLESRDHPGFYPMKPLALMVIPVQMEEQEANILDYLALLISSDYLISIRNSKMARFLKSISTRDSAAVLPDGSIAGILSALIMGLSLDCLRKAAKLGDRVLAMEEQMDREPASVTFEDISDKRFELLTLESIVQGQLPIMEAIISSDRSHITSESTVEYLVWAAANLKSTDRKLDWLEHIIEVMRSSLEALAQEKTNRRLGRLTILSMIFMPITFLAGVWGMNFPSMPMLEMEHGYVLAIALMCLISIVMYLYYRKKGWFK